MKKAFSVARGQSLNNQFMARGLGALGAIKKFARDVLRYASALTKKLILRSKV